MDDSISKTQGASLTRIGMVLTGVGSAAAGILDLIWGEFEPAHQPIQAWGDHIAGIPALAYVAAVLLIVGGIALSLRRTAKAGAVTLAIVYVVFTFFPLPRLITAPQVLGHHVTVYIGLLVGICQQLILFISAAVAWALLGNGARLSLLWTRLARWAFGFCSIDFGLAHLTGIQAVALMVPRWMPFGGAFWTIMTGLAFVAAGLAVISGVQDVIAARLLGLMLLVFTATVLTPGIFVRPHSHVAWGGDAYNLTAVGAVWMFAGWLARHRTWARTSQTLERASIDS